MKRILGLGLGFGLTWATAGAADPTPAKPVFVPAEYGSFNGGYVPTTGQPTPKPTIVRTQATIAVPPAPMPAPVSAPVPATPAPLPVMKPAAPVPAPLPAPVAAPVPTATQPTYTTYSVYPQPTAAPMKSGYTYPLLAANAATSPVTPTVPPGYVLVQVQAPVPAPAPAPVPAVTAPPAGTVVASGCTTCDTGCGGERPGLIRRFLNWFSSHPCPAVGPMCVPTPYQAPLQAYFPCKPTPAPNYAGCDTRCGRTGLGLGLLGGRKCGDETECPTCGGPRLARVRTATSGATCATGCQTGCNPCGGSYSTVLGWWHTRFGGNAPVAVAAPHPAGPMYGSWPTHTAAPTPAVAPVPTAMPAPAANTSANTANPTGMPSADWLAGYRFATTGRGPAKNTAPTVLPADPARQPFYPMTSPAAVATPAPATATPVSASLPFTNP